MHSGTCTDYRWIWDLMDLKISALLSYKKTDGPFLRYSNGWSDQWRTLRTLPLFFILTSQLKHWWYYKAWLITYDVIMKNNGKVRDVRILACKIEALKRSYPVRGGGEGIWSCSLLHVCSRIALVSSFSFTSTILGSDSDSFIDLYA